MSLRQKIILLFGLLSVLPLLGLAAFSYWQARSLLLDVAQRQLEEDARLVAARLEELGSAISADLEEIRRYERGSPQRSDILDPGGSPGRSILLSAAYIGRTTEDGSVSPLRGSIPDRRYRCWEGWNSQLVTFSSGHSGGLGKGVIQAGFWASDLLEFLTIRPGLFVALIDREDGSLLFGGSCRRDPAETPTRFRSDPRDDSRSGDRAEWLRLADLGAVSASADSDVESLGLSVVVTSSFDQVLGPLRNLTFLYWAIVLSLGAFTALAFSILTARYTQSLSRLAQAAEEIGLGELDPWLPLASSRELGQLTVAFSRMLERIRRMMDQVNQSGRLAVIGQLSAYLAHEIRNPLSSIKLNQQRILRWVEAGRLPGYCREPIEISLREVERLNTSVTGVLQLSKTSDSPRELVQLRSVLEEAADLLRSRFKRQGVEIALDLDPYADLILARPGQIKSMALNVMVNALDAQPNGGRLLIRTRLCRSPEDGSPAVSIHFQDDGPGVPAEIQDRIFEPFFTTKKSGAGIGLAMVKQAVEENEGQIHLLASFSKDKGAEFVLIFPLAPSGAQTETRVREAYSRSNDPFRPANRGQLPGGRHPLVLFTPGGLERALKPSGGSSEEDH
jgi:signal transduction histidine kinase